MADNPFFHRPQYAKDLAEQLLKPTALQLQVRSGVFLSGIRRIGKTTFLRQDLIPALESMQALVIYVDLWADRSKSPALLVHEAVKSTLSELSSPGAKLLERFKSLNVGAAGFSFGFQVDTVGKPGGATLSEVFTELVDKVSTNVVLIMDEVQQALVTEDGNNLLFALKAARDAVNTRPGTPGYLLFLGTGSHKSLMADMATRRSQPFAGAVATEYEPLGAEFVRWKHEELQRLEGIKLPSQEVMHQGFLAIGQRPEELQNALVLLQSRPEDPIWPSPSSARPWPHQRQRWKLPPSNPWALWPRPSLTAWRMATNPANPDSFQRMQSSNTQRRSGYLSTRHKSRTRWIG